MEVSQKTGKHGGMEKRLAALVVVLLIAIAGVIYWGWHRSNSPSPNKSNTASNSSSQNSNSNASSTSTASTADTCSDLALSRGSSYDMGGGATEWHAVITNNGSQSCTLTGYPGAYIKDSNSVVIGATDDPLYDLNTVKLAANGGKAHVLVGVGGIRNLSGKTVCTDPASTQLQLYLPGVVSAVQATFGEKVCNVFTITAVQPGA